MQHFEESIYDFGGADVKSCAHKQQFFIQKATSVPVDNRFQEVRQQVRIKHDLNNHADLQAEHCIARPCSD
ncbi:hypothetical protein NQ317_010102 [Molorchus minor]|uniref:Uncharacterized protein n=1 Tax=Molorchus minor TaxID=1323400 RepID=A0ABQ9IYL8_9CUCU|nr:hypothetical protein NQ317_010102 [Molorchus minor]